MSVDRREDRFRQVADWYRRLEASTVGIRERVRTRFEVDTRALAALRISLGLIILVDLLHRASAMDLFYTDDGVYPRAAYEATAGRFVGLSVHALSGDLWVQQLLFVVAGAFAVALVLGYRSRLVAVVSLGLLFSLHARNPEVLNGGDRLLRVLLFLAIFTPIGERWSIDALRRGDARRTVVGAATAALLAQPLMIFTQNAIFKHRGERWYAGEAVEIALANDAMTVHLGNHLREFSTLLTALNWIWVGLLAGSIVFLLATTGRLRALFALVYVGAFAGMATSMAVGFFPFVLSASVLPYLTAPFWDALARRVPPSLADRRPTAASLGPLARPPLERWLLERLRERGYDSAVSFGVAYARSLVTVAAVLVLCWMLLFGAAHVSDSEVPDELDSPHLDEQRWALYAPDPSEAYNWYAVKAHLPNGSSVEAFEGGQFSTDRPPDVAETYDSFRHRKFLETVRSSASGDSLGTVARSYAANACDRAEATVGQVDAVTVYRFYQPSPIDGTYEDPARFPIIEWDCRSSAPLET